MKGNRGYTRPQVFHRFGKQVVQRNGLGSDKHDPVPSVISRELGICYANISLVTDYDAGLEGRDDISPVSHDEVLKVFNANNEKLKNLLFEMIK